MRFKFSILLLLFVSLFHAQSVQDNFEGTGTITSWFGDDCSIEIGYTNPYQVGLNLSQNVLKYLDTGGQYANVRFDADSNFDLSGNSIFTFKIYVPSSSLSGNQSNQVSLKLQNGSSSTPWSTQSEIIKPIVLDQWQELSFDFQNDTYINLDNTSLPPSQRTDFNRVVTQVNGENNTDQVIAYIDDFYYDGTISLDPDYNTLVWSDEFNDAGSVDTSKWFHQTQLIAGNSWANGELQHYTNRIDNSYVSEGTLKIKAIKEQYTDQNVTKSYTSARLNSKFSFKYGRVEVRAKLPSVFGTWPAIWLLGKNISDG